MSELEVATHLRAWAYWYSRLQGIRSRAIAFGSLEEEEQAGSAAWEQWDEAACWLEAHGISDADIVYDGVTEQCSLIKVA